MFSSETLDVRIMPGPNAVLLQDFSFYSKITNKKYTVKKGFVFDGASIPKFFWRAIGHPLSYKYVRSALIHDILYASECEPRDVADDIFREMLEIDRVESWKIPAMYTAVRVGGDDVWEEEHTPESIENAKSYLRVSK